MYYMEAFAKIIAAQRKKHKMTQDELARHLGITPQAVSKWENGIGYPDITLLPLISEILHVPIEYLFGKTKQSSLPQVYDDLPLIAVNLGLACYSNKEVLRITDQEILFTDCSLASFSEAVVYNRGKGEIRLLETHEMTEETAEKKQDDETSYSEEFSGYDSIELTLSRACHTKILYDENATPRVTAQGDAAFISSLRIAKSGKMLSISFQNSKSPDPGHHNSLTVYVPFTQGHTIKLGVQGFGDADCRLGFDVGDLSISGSGSIVAKSFSRLHATIGGNGTIKTENITQNAHARINGSGNIELGSIGARLIAEISGSGEIHAAHRDGISMSISGCGDMRLKSLQNEINAQFSGSGTMICSTTCEIEHLKLTVTGSGDLRAEDIVAQDAELYLRGGASILLGRIKGTSIEKCSKDSNLTVLQRG